MVHHCQLLTVLQPTCTAVYGKMLLRTLWSRLGAQLHVERKPVSSWASAHLSQSIQTHQYESKTRTYSNWSGPRICHFNTLHQQQTHTRHVLPALVGFKSLCSNLLRDPGMLTKYGSGQKRFYSPDLVKSVLKPSLKPAAVPGKRVPKGPRTKQPSRANQPSLNVDEVIQPSSNAWLIFLSVGLYMSCFCFNDYFILVFLCRIWCNVLPLQQQISIICQHFATTW